MAYRNVRRFPKGKKAIGCKWYTARKKQCQKIKGDISLLKIHTNENVFDMLMKSVSMYKFKHFLDLIVVFCL